MSEEDRFTEIYLGTFNSYDEPQKQIVCKCGNEVFKLIFTDRYALSGICTKCGAQQVVYDG